MRNVGLLIQIELNTLVLKIVCIESHLSVLTNGSLLSSWTQILLIPVASSQPARFQIKSRIGHTSMLVWETSQLWLETKLFLKPVELITNLTYLILQYTLSLKAGYPFFFFTQGTMFSSKVDYPTSIDLDKFLKLREKQLFVC